MTVSASVIGLFSVNTKAILSHYNFYVSQKDVINVCDVKTFLFLPCPLEHAWQVH